MSTRSDDNYSRIHIRTHRIKNPDVRAKGRVIFDGYTTFPVSKKSFFKQLSDPGEWHHPSFSTIHGEIDMEYTMLKDYLDYEDH